MTDTLTVPTGPGHAAIDRTDDGRPWITVSKSWLNTFDTCPRLAKHILDGDRSDLSNQATFLGTCFHTLAETALCWWQTWRDEPTEEAAPIELGYAVANAQWVDGAHLHAPHKSITSLANGSRILAQLAKLWFAHVVPQIHPDVSLWRIEQTRRLTVIDHHLWRVDIHGTADLIDATKGWDWKTGATPRRWEVERYDRQSTIYSWLHNVPEFVLAHIPREQAFSDWDENNLITVERGPEHRTELVDYLNEIAGLVAVGLDVWPRRSTGYMCSSRWCFVHARGECRGEHLPIHAVQIGGNQ